MTVLVRTEQITGASIVVYLSLGPVLLAGFAIGTRTQRMPGFVLLGVIVDVVAGDGEQLLLRGRTHDDGCPLHCVRLQARNPRRPLYAVGTVFGLMVSGIVQDDRRSSIARS